MKYFFIHLLLLCCLILSSCVKDLGNYTYLSKEEVFPAEVSLIEKEINEFPRGEILKISPQFENMDDFDDYSYEWSVSGTTIKKGEMVLSNEKDLNVKIMLDEGKYKLYFRFTHLKKNLFKQLMIPLSVKFSLLSVGWYILKEKNNHTDFDYITKDKTIHSDILTQENKQLQGRPVAMLYQDQKYFHQQQTSSGKIETLINKKVFHVLSDSEFYTFSAADLTLWKTFSDQFYVSPEGAPNPQFIYFGPRQELYFMNDGKIYLIDSEIFNIGKFTPKIGEDILFPAFHRVGVSGEILLFNTTKRSFCTAAPFNYSLSPLPDQTLGREKISLQEMSYTMQWMINGFPAFYKGQAFALMKSTEAATAYRLVRFTFGFGLRLTQLLWSFNDLPPETLLLNSSVIACQAEGAFLYFAIDNKIYSYADVPGTSLADREKVEITLPSNEKISYMQNIYVNDKNCFAVLSNTPDNKWKLYVYAIKIAGDSELVTTPLENYSGTGRGHYLIYRE